MSRSPERHSSTRPRLAVFGTTELLEKILLELPARSLFKIQRVCKRFRDTIAQSVQIQRALMLRRSDSPRLVWKLVIDEPGPPDWKLPHERNPQFISVQPGETHPQRSLFTPMKFSPLFRFEPYSHFVLGGRHNTALHMLGAVGQTVGFDFLPDVTQYHSWEEVFVSDPPATKAQVVLRFVLRNSRGREMGWCILEDYVEDTDGLRMGNLIRVPLQDERSRKAYWWVHGLLRHDNEGLDRFITLGRKMGMQPVVLDLAQSSVILHYMVSPTEEEWRTVER